MGQSKHHKKNISNSQWRKRSNRKRMRRKWLEGIKRAWTVKGQLISNHLSNNKPDWW